MTSYLHRKFIDLIQTTSAKYVNWDPLNGEIRVGAYGLVDKETGVLRVEGNVYDPEFQEELDKHKVDVDLVTLRPQEGPVEDDLVIASRGAKRTDLDADKEAEVSGIANAPFKGKWVFERRDKREAVLVLHKPRLVSLPPNVVLEPLYQIDKLVEKVIITSIYVCSGYSMYLSEKSIDTTSNTLSVALLSKETTASTSGALTWWIDNPNGVVRQGYDETGNNSFTTLYTLRRAIKRIRRHFRDKIRPEPVGDELWHPDSPPWDPLDEEGVEDPIDPEVYRVDPFAGVNEAARKKAEAEAAAAAAAALAALTPSQ